MLKKKKKNRRQNEFEYEFKLETTTLLTLTHTQPPAFPLQISGLLEMAKASVKVVTPSKYRPVLFLIMGLALGSAIAWGWSKRPGSQTY